MQLSQFVFNYFKIIIMSYQVLISKTKRLLWKKLIRSLRDKPVYNKLYASYWHYKFRKNVVVSSNKQHYFTAIPNIGAGIGHQMANWISGYWFAKLLNLEFAHVPFSSSKWEKFLGFGADEVLADWLINIKGYKKVLLPLFDEHNPNDLNLIRCIIDSYRTEKIVFFAEQDQCYQAQYGIQDTIRKKFYNSTARAHDSIIYDNKSFNIAVHVRRGDIVVGQVNKNPNLLLRWQDNDYYINAIKNVLSILDVKKEIKVYIFSQGEGESFEEFNTVKNVQLCLDMNAQDTFLHMVHSDLLITSKSSFSYKPGLINNGIKVCPRNFWLGYPTTKDYILMNDDGSFSDTIKTIKC